MTQSDAPAYLWTLPGVGSLPVKGRVERAPVNRLFFVGRNYHANARDMGASADKPSSRPFYFTKSPQALVESGATISYPPQTKDFHREMELVLVVGAHGFEARPERAVELVFGYARGLDMTRRDLQRAARDKGLPWTSLGTPRAPPSSPRSFPCRAYSSTAAKSRSQ
jgi:fumarylpyruvate hydrolase